MWSGLKEARDGLNDALRLLHSRDMNSEELDDISSAIRFYNESISIYKRLLGLI